MSGSAKRAYFYWVQSGSPTPISNEIAQLNLRATTIQAVTDKVATSTILTTFKRDTKSNVSLGFTATGGFTDSTFSGSNNVGVGNVALGKLTTGSNNVGVGHNAAISCRTGSGNAVIGHGALWDNIDGSYNTAVGTSAGNNNTGSSNTFIGYRAGRGSSSKSFNNTTCIGVGSVATDSNQIVLGTAVNTVIGGQYNVISDARDKSEIRDTIIGLDFISQLRPVDYKCSPRNSSDDTPAGKRFHHGLIAQEVKVAMDTMGVDFGGYQDHKVNGGADQLTLGYSELIAPMIQSIKELSAKICELESKNAALATRLAAVENQVQ
jgi:hypothetical protein